MTEQNQQSLLLGKIAAYTEILVKDPSSTIFVSLAETYRKMGMLDDARQIVFKGLDLHSDFSPAHIVLARILCQLEDFEGSVAEFERALELDEESLAALVGYARVQILLGEEATARELLLKARSLSPADPIINKLLLSLPEEIEATDEQVEEDIVQSEDSVANPAALVSSTLADLYLAQGLTEKALGLFQRLSIQNPDDLTLRRRVKELESELRGGNQDVANEPVEVLSNQQEDVMADTVSLAEDDDTADQQLYETGAEKIVSEPVDSFTHEPVFDTLNRWLSNIQQRRENV
ncbi:MAG: tetratricopeptide repeat protein [Desulfuromusa sp.]|jgi:tetratricopeptide (TPR) repeat protein|nr:tetratricopeptide repeat protein [Desulfuromusa sp.]